MREKQVRYVYYLKYEFLSLGKQVWVCPCLYKTKEDAQASVKDTIESEMSKEYGWRNMRAYIKKVTF